MTKQRKSPRLERLTLSELQPIIEDYHRHFPTWRLLEGTLIARESGPLLQYIGFERLLGGAFRIQYGVYYLCVPDRDGGFPPQYLGIKRSIYPRAHVSIRDKMLAAFHKEISPNIDVPLDVEQVLSMHENQTISRSSDAHHLAALNSYLGHDRRALHWCDRFFELVEQPGMPWQECNTRRQAFLHSLRQWIATGTAKARLQEVVQEERRRWGLA
jgi:hypothetical protein